MTVAYSKTKSPMEMLKHIKDTHSQALKSFVKHQLLNCVNKCSNCII